MAASPVAPRGEAPLALTAEDARAYEATSDLRSRLADTIADGGVDSEAMNLAAALGRALAADGASPSLASSVLDPGDPALRATLFEAYCAAREEARAGIEARRWELPGCAVKLGDTTFAVCANPPHDDDAAAAWADRVAAGLLKRGARDVVLSGAGPARTRLQEALDLVGVAWRDDGAPPPRRSWLRLPWSTR